MRQPARADERRLRADNNCKQRERAADESGHRGKEGIAREWAAGGRDSAHKRQTRTDGRRDERRWWAADDVTRVADDDGRQTMMSGDERG